jgi:glycosyltransferase involved in cell wall biosynthesis
MISSQLFAAAARRQLARKLAALHAATPYDFVYQFSTFESFGVPRKRRGLPVLIHPSVHAAGERRWVARERSLSLSNDGALRTSVTITWLALREMRQRRDARRATGILALSPGFAEEISRDYGVDPSKIRVVANCIDLNAVAAVDPSSHDLMVVGRVVVRKGLQDVVALSHELGRIDGRLRLRVVGSPSLWSDYQRVLTTGDPATLVVEGSRSRSEVFREVGGALALLQLSRYEPFGLSVAEALALGVPVIVTSAVGAAQFVASDVKIVVAPGNLDELVAAVATLAELRDDERALLSRRCRVEAERHFSPAVVADELVRAINELLSAGS